MQSIRITQADGSAWTQDLRSALLNIGRAADNDLVLDDAAVSSKHCLIEFDGYNYIVKDRGSANGTFINNAALAEPTVLREGDRLYVGPFLIELVSMAPEQATRVALPPRRQGPLIRGANPKAEEHRESERLRRWAMEWDAEGRVRRLLLRSDALTRAEALLAQPQSSVASNPLIREFVSRSRSASTMRTAVLLAAVSLVIIIVGGAGGAGYYWWSAHRAAETVADDSDAEPVDESEAPEVAEAVDPGGDDFTEQQWVDHAVIPAESLDDIARRYEVALADVAKWNRLNPDDPQIQVGQALRIQPNARPLPQQEIAFELDQPYDWQSLAERFDVEVSRLRAYNPQLGELKVGDIITVWIDPKPYEQRTLDTIPIFDIRPDAVSVGRPNDGRLQNGIQLPASDLYTRRAPFIQWGSSNTIRTLQTAVAIFRQEVSFEGKVVISDISRKNGGLFYPPHRSHQAGRDIDIWMPTLKGVYKKNYLDKERKPKPPEIDWYATWGLIRALISTDQIVHIFLNWELQEKLLHAARLMGATDEELKRCIQYPRRGAPAIVQAVPGHSGHIHIRFKCGPNDIQCKDDIAFGEP